MNNAELSLLVRVGTDKAQEDEERRRQNACRHHFLFTHMFDFENDRLLDIKACEHCGLQK